MGEETTFVPAPRTTAADAANDRTSLNRKLDDKLYLITKAAGVDGEWRMPQAAYDESESTLRAAAERCLAEFVSPETEVHFVGNFPVMCETTEFASESDGVVGSKRFYFRAALISMSADVELPADKFTEHAWVTKSELDQYDPEYATLLHSFMP
jgi:large subunit ribosomal protein L46